MRKIIMLAMVLTTLVISAFANYPNAVNKKVLNTFNKSFKYAEEVRWEIKKELYKVSFKYGDREMFAYYNGDGEEVALARNIHTEQLPLTLASELKSGYNEYWLTNLFEISSNGETKYYATVQSPTHITILKADGTIGWTTFKRDKIK